MIKDKSGNAEPSIGQIPYGYLVNTGTCGDSAVHLLLVYVFSSPCCAGRLAAPARGGPQRVTGGPAPTHAHLSKMAGLNKTL